ncbi:MAG: hypothetical protein IH984_04855 [Planctomycetes bacterium]|nr:hypothetical protein [Planctomycetota bacterium]
MAARTGAGIGVVVSLVVFVMTAISLLVLSIMFYAGKTEALQGQEEAENLLAKYVTTEQSNREEYKALVASASSGRGKSVTGLLLERGRKTSQWLVGNENRSLDDAQSDLSQYGAGKDAVVQRVLQDFSRSSRNQVQEIEGLESSLADAQDDLAERDAQMRTLEENQRSEIDAINAQLNAYMLEAEEHRDRLIIAEGDYNAAIDRLDDRYSGQINDLQNSGDRLNEDNVRLRSRVGELQEIIGRNRVHPDRPDLMVDGRIIDQAGGADQVFIDRGKKHHIVLGMTFEVYEDERSIQVDRRTGLMSRGKASLQVTTVAETTSTCKIIRSVPGRPVVRNDVIVNAVYDPNYKFKFLIHGKFDVNGDGKPSSAEANYLGTVVTNWGGTVITGDELPGDLDFLVLGVQPPIPPGLPTNATERQIEIWVEKRNAYEKYLELMNQAMDAQIPVLNANRFFILTGHTSF